MVIFLLFLIFFMKLVGRIITMILVYAGIFMLSVIYTNALLFT